MLSDDGSGGISNYELWFLCWLYTEYIAADPGSNVGILRMHILTGNWDPGYCSAGYCSAVPSTKYKAPSNAEHRGLQSTDSIPIFLSMNGVDT